MVDDLNHWMRRHGNTAGTTEVNVNVKETVHVFNAIAAQRETYVLLRLQIVFYKRALPLFHTYAQFIFISPK